MARKAHHVRIGAEIRFRRCDDGVYIHQDDLLAMLQAMCETISGITSACQCSVPVLHSLAQNLKKASERG